MNLRTIAPLDEAAILDAIAACRVLVTVEDHLLVGGLYAAVAEMLVRHQVSVPVVPLGLDGRWFRPGRLADVLEHEGFSAARLVTRFKKALAEHGGASRRRTPAPAVLSIAGGLSSNRIAFNPDYPSIASSDALFARATDLIPGGTQTLAKGVGQHVRGVAPKYLHAARARTSWTSTATSTST